MAGGDGPAHLGVLEPLTGTRAEPGQHLTLYGRPSASHHFSQGSALLAVKWIGEADPHPACPRVIAMVSIREAWGRAGLGCRAWGPGSLMQSLPSTSCFLVFLPGFPYRVLCCEQHKATLSTISKGGHFLAQSKGLQSGQENFQGLRGLQGPGHQGQYGQDSLVAIAPDIKLQSPRREWPPDQTKVWPFQLLQWEIGPCPLGTLHRGIPPN